MKEEHNGQFDNKITELFNGCCKYKKYHWNRVLFSRLYCLHLLMSCIRFTGGSYYTHKGAAVELLCLPRNPEWGIYIDGHDGAKNNIHGAEYETGTYKGYMKTVHYHDVPCAVCMVLQKSLIKMFPG